jgi:hypothetical protein
LLVKAAKKGEGPEASGLTGVLIGDASTSCIVGDTEEGTAWFPSARASRRLEQRRRRASWSAVVRVGEYWS